MRPDPDTGRSLTGRGAAVEQLLAARGRHLMQAAIALAGSRQDGEDLLQAALERLLLNYRRVSSDAEGYLRRTLYNLAADGWRRRGVARRWRPVVAAPDRSADGTDAVDIRDTLVRLLAQLPPRAANGGSAAVLGAAERGRDRRDPWLLARIGQVGGLAWHEQAARACRRPATQAAYPA